MTSTDFLCLSPFLIIAGAPIIIMLTVTVIRNLKVIYGFSLFMFLAAFLSLFLVSPHAPHTIDPLITIDSFSLMFLGLIFIASLLITVLSYEYFKKHSGDREEYFIILFVAVLGASLLVVANHFISFFLGLETLSISLYILIAYLRSRDHSIEAGVKFLVIASVATAFLLFGMGLIYAETGAMSFGKIISSVAGATHLTPIMMAGTALVLAGIGFKLALAPFHMWTPDIYQGAPAPVTTFIATISKGAVLALVLRLFANTGLFHNATVVLVVSGISIVSMFTGNLLALKQSNIKRLLAYSSIAQLGYVLIALLTGTTAGTQAAVFYMIAYVTTSLGAFGVISAVSGRDRDAENISDFRGLFWRKPWIAAVLTLAMISLAGLPLTAGFMSKFYLVLSGVKSGFWILAFSLVINSVISLYYYLRVVKAMFDRSEETAEMEKIPLMVNLVLAVIAVGILFLGIFPAFVTDIITGF